MTNHLARYKTVHPDIGVGFDHEGLPRSIRLMTFGTASFWIAWRTPQLIVANPDGSPRHFASASRAARYMEEHPNHD